MLLTTDDLTRHDGGDVLGARLPSDLTARPAAATEIVSRAVLRWALHSVETALRERVEELLTAHVATEPLDLHLRITATEVHLTVGTTTRTLALTPTSLAA